ncbi:MAG TPA: autotransporter domain-containing protein [Rhodanobacteraceae bacterium]
MHHYSWSRGSAAACRGIFRWNWCGALVLLCIALAWPNLARAGLGTPDCPNFNVPDSHTTPSTSPMASGTTITIDASSCDPTGYIAGIGPVVTQPTHGSASIDTLNEIVSYTNNGDGASTDSFSFDDADGNPITVTVSIGPATSPITVTPASLPTPHVGVDYGSVSLSASGGTAPYTYTLTGGSLPPGMTFTGGSSGTFSGTPTHWASYTVNIQVADSAGHSTTKGYDLTVPMPTITLSSLPSPSVGVPYNQTITASGGTSPYHNFSVQPGGTFPPGLNLSSSGVVTGTPTTAGTYNFVVQVFDSSSPSQYGGTHTYALTVNTASVPGAPTIGTATAGNAQASISFTAPASNGGAAITQYTATSSPSGLTGACASSPCTVTGLTNGTAYTFTVTATNSVGTGAPSAASNSVTPSTVPGAPTSVVAANDGSGGATVTFVAPGSNGGAVITGYTVTSSPAGGVDSNAGTTALTHAITGLTNGTAYTFTVTATNADGTGPASSPSNSVTPVAAPSSLTYSPSAYIFTKGQASTTATPTYSGGSLTGCTVSPALPAGLAISSSDCVISGTPTALSTIPVNYTVTAANSGGSTTATVSIAVNDVAPSGLSYSPNTYVFTEGQASTTATPTYSGGSLTGCTVSPALPAGLAISSSDCTISGTPTALSTIPVNYTVTAANSGGSTTATVSVAVNPAAPVASDKSVSTSYDTAASIDLSGSITGAGITAVTIGTAPAHGTVSVSGETVTYTPSSTYYGGSDSFTYTATNPGGTSAPATVTITVGTPAAPTAAAKSVSTAYNTAASIDLSGSITGVDITGIAIGTAPLHGTVSVSGETVTYTPSSTYYGGSDSFTYTATNPGGTSAPATVTITVTPLSVPAAASLDVSTTTGMPVTIAATTGASGPQPFTGVSVASAPDHGSASVQGMQIVYQPFNGFVGTDKFTYQVMNHFGNSTPATITVTVTAAGSVGSATGTKTLATTPGTPVTVDLGQVLPDSYVSASVTGVAPGTAGNVMLAAPTTLTFTPAQSFRGLVQISAVLTSASGRKVTIDLLVLVSTQPDPSKNPDALGLVNAQTAQAQRFAQSQLGNINARLASLHDGGSSALFSETLSVSVGGQQSPCDRTANAFASMPHDNASYNVALGSMGQPHCRNADNTWSDPSDGSASQVKTGHGHRGLGAWVDGTVDFGAFDPYRQASGFDSTNIAVNVGVDQRIGTRGLVGVSVGYNRDSADIANDGTRSQAHGYSAAVYGSYQPTAQVYIDAILGGGKLDFDSRRFDGDTATFLYGQRSGSQWFGSLTAGYEYRAENGLQLSPYLRWQQSLSNLDGYAEQGAATGALSYGRETVRTSTGILGLRMSQPITRDWGVLVPRARVEIGHDFQGTSDTTLSYAFIPSLGSWNVLTNPYTANGTSVQLGLGIDMQLPRSLRLLIDYEYLTQPHAHDQMIRFGVDKTF